MTALENPFAPDLLIESRGPVRLVTLNRPEELNPVNEALQDALAEVWPHLARDESARAVVLTGAGRAFSAGGDFQHFIDVWDDRDFRAKSIESARQLMSNMVDFPLPVVAAVNGAAVGLGCNLAALCDIVLIAESAYLADPHVNVGLTAADGGAPTWPLLMSMLQAKEYLFTGERIPATRAVELGLANRVVPDGEVLDQALALADTLAKKPPQALRTTKRALNMHIRRAITGVLEYALSEEYHSFDTAEHRDIVTKFIDRSKQRAAAAQ